MPWCHETVGAALLSQLHDEHRVILSPQLITSHVSSSDFLLALLHLSSDIRGEAAVSDQNQWLGPEGGTLAVYYCLAVLCPVAF